jgi:anaerobic selenocysteine-containing dehydrogenase
MTRWHKTGCVLCAQNCGLEVQVADNRMVKIRPGTDALMVRAMIAIILDRGAKQ